MKLQRIVEPLLDSLTALAASFSSLSPSAPPTQLEWKPTLDSSSCLCVNVVPSDLSSIIPPCHEGNRIPLAQRPRCHLLLFMNLINNLPLCRRRYCCCCCWWRRRRRRGKVSWKKQKEKIQEPWQWWDLVPDDCTNNRQHKRNFLLR